MTCIHADIGDIGCYRADSDAALMQPPAFSIPSARGQKAALSPKQEPTPAADEEDSQVSSVLDRTACSSSQGIGSTWLVGLAVCYYHTRAQSQCRRFSLLTAASEQIDKTLHAAILQQQLQKLSASSTIQSRMA